MKVCRQKMLSVQINLMLSEVVFFIHWRQNFSVITNGRLFQTVYFSTRTPLAVCTWNIAPINMLLYSNAGANSIYVLCTVYCTYILIGRFVLGTHWHLHKKNVFLLHFEGRLRDVGVYVATSHNLEPINILAITKLTAT